MILEQFTQDIRVGVRVLLKDKVFFLLSILGLALGIGGAMTQFTVVNAIVLRGFSFPHPEQLASVGLIDPKASDQNNNFGNGNIPSAQDYEDIKAAQESFADGLLDCPHYTRPVEHALGSVPAVLMSGNHAEIARWRRQQALGRTWLRRPDLVDVERLSKADRQLLDAFLAGQPDAPKPRNP
jgi:hypothetical protein